MRGFLRFVSEWKTAASLSFTAAAVIYAAVSLLYGEETVGIGKLLSLLLVCALGSAIQYLCFTDDILKKMRYTRRALLFLALFFPLLAGAAWLFRWFPTDQVGAWLVFGGAFAAAFAVFTLGFELFYRAAGRKYDGLLGQYRRERERRGERAPPGRGKGKQVGKQTKRAGGGGDLLRPAPAGFLPHEWSRFPSDFLFP